MASITNLNAIRETPLFLRSSNKIKNKLKNGR